MLLDNYIANVFGEPMIANNMRIDRMMDHPITYGIRMAKGSDRLEKCLREYLRDNRQEVFDIFKKFLKPVKVIYMSIYIRHKSRISVKPS